MSQSQQSHVSLLFELKYCPTCIGHLFLPNYAAMKHNVTDEPRALFQPCPHCLECIERFLAARDGTQGAGG